MVASVGSIKNLYKVLITFLKSLHIRKLNPEPLGNIVKALDALADEFGVFIFLFARAAFHEDFFVLGEHGGVFLVILGKNNDFHCAVQIFKGDKRHGLICDGALVLSKMPTNKAYIQHDAPDFGTLRLGAQKQKGRYAFTKKKEDKDVFLAELRQGEEMIDKLDGVHPISEISEKMIASINGEEIAYARRENMKHLWTLLNGKVKMISGIERAFDGAPFSLPILVESREVVQKQLAQQGVYAPVLWPIADEARAICSVSARMADKMLSIPIDQRYYYDDIEDIASIVLSTCSK